jgi:hypothetical protein
VNVSSWLAASHNALSRCQALRNPRIPQIRDDNINFVGNIAREPPLARASQTLTILISNFEPGSEGHAICCSTRARTRRGTDRRSGAHQACRGKGYREKPLQKARPRAGECVLLSGRAASDRPTAAHKIEGLSLFETDALVFVFWSFQM